MEHAEQHGTSAADLLVAAPAGAVAVPGDYDGDGFTDFALKGANGIWYIDMAACSGARCLDPDGFGGRWDFAYPGYGDATAIPVPADYDGDGKTDLAVKDATGMWAIDYAANGFGVWDVMVFGYGDSTVVPVPADYDGDGKADIAIKTTSGLWYIDLAADGFGSWDPRTPFGGYGNASAIPVPADYDGDGCADLAVKDPYTTPTGAIGTWYIDYATVPGQHCGLGGFTGWNAIYSGYGNASAVPVPADYDGDGKADFAIKDSGGTWLIDYASNGFGGWDASSGGYGGSTAKAIPGHYDLARPASDHRLDLAYKDTSGNWRVNLVANGLAPSAWDTIPGTGATSLYNPGRPAVNTAQPYITWTRMYLPIDAAPSVPRGGPAAGDLTPPAPLVNGHWQLRIGVRYTVAVHLTPGGVFNNVGVELNPDLHVPASLVVTNPVGTTFNWVTSDVTRVFAVTCTQPGSFPLGFMLRDAGPPVGTGNVENPDYGIRVDCIAEHTGLYGTVTSRVRDPFNRYVAGAPIAGASVAVTGPVNATTTTAADGSWTIPQLTGGPYKVAITAAGKTATTAYGVRVPAGAGTKVDTALETQFTNLGPGVLYKQYLDYTRGRTLLHVIEVDPAASSIKLAVTDMANGNWTRLIGNAQAHGAPVIMNGGFFGGPQLPCEPHPVTPANAVGYFYSRGFVTSLLLACDGTLPMFTIKGTGVGQQIKIVTSEANFESTASSQWTQTAGGPIYDPVAPKGVSDVDFAMQMAPVIVTAGREVPPPDMAWARTTVGRNASRFWLVVADGEGVNGGNGANWVQLAAFYRSILGATDAMGLDGGLSTELVLRESATSWRNVNTITGEDSSWDSEPSLEGETLETHYGAGGQDSLPGSVFNYVSVGI